MQLRVSWLGNVRNRFAVSIDQLRTTREDVLCVFADLPESSTGPDGIPFQAFGAIGAIAEDLIFEISHAMIDGTV